MTKFKTNDFKVKEDQDQDEVRVVKFNAPTEPDVKAFSLPALQPMGAGYANVKAKYGLLAVTDGERTARTRKDSRFSLNPLLRDPLSVEEEERRAIEEKVRARVEAMAQEAKGRAEQTGYQDGLKKGHQEAYAKFQAEGQKRLEELTALFNQVESAKTDIFRANERFLIELIFRIAKMVLLRELQTDREYLLRLTRDLIERVGARENITIRISQEDVQTMEMIKEGLAQMLGGLKNVNVQTSNQVKHGGCVVETEWNAIDASVETQLKSLYESLVGKESDPGAGSGA